MHCVSRFMLGVVIVSLSAQLGWAQRTEKGAVLGGLSGAGLGAIIGNQSGKAGPGAAIGAVAGMLAGAAIGDSIDETEARNRAYIESRIGRQMVGAVSYEDVVSMTRAGLGDEVISTHIRNHGMMYAPGANEMIWLKQQGVSDFVIRTMQQPIAPPQPVVVSRPPPPPIIVTERVYDPWCHDHYHYRPYSPPRYTWGVEFHNHR